MRSARLFVLLGTALWLSLQGCSSGEYSVTRRGGPFPTYPAEDLPLGGSGGTGVVEEAGAATGGLGAAGEPAVVLTPWCEAYEVMQRKCHRCHGDPQLNGAPFSLLTWADTQEKYSNTKQRYQRMQDVVTSGFMPYVEGNSLTVPIMPPVEPLSVEEKATLLQWLSEGAPRESDSTCP